MLRVIGLWKEDRHITRNRCRGCLLFLETFMSVPSLTNIYQKKQEKKHMKVTNCCIRQLCFIPWEGLQILFFRCHNRTTCSCSFESETVVVLTLPGFRRSLLPLTLYSMWTRRSRFSWGSRESRDGGRLTSDGRKRRLSLFVNEREGGRRKGMWYWKLNRRG